MIYVFMRGRIGNQLFIQSTAEELRKKRGLDEEIVIDDYEVLDIQWENSLVHYNLENVKYVHTREILKRPSLLFRYILLRIFKKLTYLTDYNNRYKMEKAVQPIFNRMGIITCENGYLEYNVPRTKDVLLDGFFQSEKYFSGISEYLKNLFGLEEQLDKIDYPNLDKIKNRNTVCISIKVEHNVGNSIYDVCNNGYWGNAIKYIVENVENPLFFICSDNVDYVKEHLIDCSKFDCVSQDKNQPVHISLAAMAQCKHFIIGNTTFGWWAQYLSKYDIDKKIVVVPSKWMAIDMPIDIYQENWHLEEV